MAVGAPWEPQVSRLAVLQRQTKPHEFQDSIEVHESQNVHSHYALEDLRSLPKEFGQSNLNKKSIAWPENRKEK